VSEPQVGVTTDLYYSSAGQVVEEQQSGVTTAWNIWGPVYVDALIVRERPPGATGAGMSMVTTCDGGGDGASDGDPGTGLTGLSDGGGFSTASAGGGISTLDATRYWAVQDANWNVTAVVSDTATADSAAVAERYAYDPYGNPTFLTATWGSEGSSSIHWSYLFQDKRYDTTAGLFDFNARVYSPTLMRFLQNDPTEFDAGDQNFYRFVGDSPIDRVDPSGEQWYDYIPVAGQLIGIGAGWIDQGVEAKRTRVLDDKLDAIRKKERDSRDFVADYGDIKVNLGNGSAREMIGRSLDPNLEANAKWTKDNAETLAKVAVQFNAAGPSLATASTPFFVTFKAGQFASAQAAGKGLVQDVIAMRGASAASKISTFRAGAALGPVDVSGRYCTTASG
jgi:RHS repeat-associated protein